MKTDVSVIIVSYNTKNFIVNCIDSILKETKDIIYEIIISDNGSTDGSIEFIKDKYISKFNNILLIENNYNFGFGTANNIAKKKAKGKYVFFLNSDTIIHNNVLKIFFDFWEGHKSEPISALGSILTNGYGMSIHSGGLFPSYTTIYNQLIDIHRRNIIKASLKLLHLDSIVYSHRHYEGDISGSSINDSFDYVTGADLFMKNDENAIFDENFFMYYEETDMQLQLMKKGLHCVILTEPLIDHLNNKNKNVNSFGRVRATEIYSQISALYYCKKNLMPTDREFNKLRTVYLSNANNPYVRDVFNSTVDSYKRYLKKVGININSWL